MIQATRAAFRQWLKSHGDPQANTAEPPTADRAAPTRTAFCAIPAREKRLIDFARFQQQEMADHVAAMAAACRRGTDCRKLVVFFFGYLFEFSRPAGTVRRPAGITPSPRCSKAGTSTSSARRSPTPTANGSAPPPA